MFDFSISTVDEVLFEGKVVSVTAPGSEGEFTILANHSPLIATLKSGVVKVRTKKGDKESDLQEFEINDGLLETSGNHTTILL